MHGYCPQDVIARAQQWMQGCQCSGDVLHAGGKLVDESTEGM